MRDQGTSQLNVASNPNQNEETNASTDENSYFVDVRKIRVSLRNKVTGILEKREVTIHMDCIKQLEILKQQKQKALPNPELQNGSAINRSSNSIKAPEPILGRRPPNDILNSGEQNEDKETMVKRQRLEENKGASWNKLQTLIGGLNHKNTLN